MRALKHFLSVLLIMLALAGLAASVPVGGFDSSCSIDIKSESGASVCSSGSCTLEKQTNYSLSILTQNTNPAERSWDKTCDNSPSDGKCEGEIGLYAGWSGGSSFTSFFNFTSPSPVRSSSEPETALVLGSGTPPQYTLESSFTSQNSSGDYGLTVGTSGYGFALPDSDLALMIVFDASGSMRYDFDGDHYCMVVAEKNECEMPLNPKYYNGCFYCKEGSVKVIGGKTFTCVKDEPADQCGIYPNPDFDAGERRFDRANEEARKLVNRLFDAFQNSSKKLKIGVSSFKYSIEGGSTVAERLRHGVQVNSCAFAQGSSEAATHFPYLAGKSCLLEDRAKVLSSIESIDFWGSTPLGHGIDVSNRMFERAMVLEGVGSDWIKAMVIITDGIPTITPRTDGLVVAQSPLGWDTVNTGNTFHRVSASAPSTFTERWSNDLDSSSPPDRKRAKDYAVAQAQKTKQDLGVDVFALGIGREGGTELDCSLVSGMNAGSSDIKCPLNSEEFSQAVDSLLNYWYLEKFGSSCTLSLSIPSAPAPPNCGNGAEDLGENCENCPADVQCSAGLACCPGGSCQPSCSITPPLPVPAIEGTGKVFINDFRLLDAPVRGQPLVGMAAVKNTQGSLVRVRVFFSIKEIPTISTQIVGDIDAGDEEVFQIPQGMLDTSWGLLEDSRPYTLLVTVKKETIPPAEKPFLDSVEKSFVLKTPEASVPEANPLLALLAVLCVVFLLARKQN